MLFKVHSDIASGDKDFFEMNPGAKAMKEFNDCTSRQMFFVCLVADRDYDSLLRTLAERTRRERAALIAGYPMEGNRPDKNARNLINGKIELVEKAITKYYEIQYDEERAMRDASNKQIQEALDTINTDKEGLAKVVKTATNKKTGEKTTTEYIDAKMLHTLKMTAVALQKELPAMREARNKLFAATGQEPSLKDVLTYSSQDVTEETEDLLDGEGSTLDAFNQKRFKK